MADPAFREARARYERQRWANGHAARRHAIYRADSAAIQDLRATLPPDPKNAAPKLELTPERAAYKRTWQRAHAEGLNARRSAARVANPQKYRAQEHDRKKRRRTLVKQIDEKLEPAAKTIA